MTNRGECYPDPTVLIVFPVDTSTHASSTFNWFWMPLSSTIFRDSDPDSDGRFVSKTLPDVVVDSTEEINI